MLRGAVSPDPSPPRGSAGSSAAQTLGPEARPALSGGELGGLLAHPSPAGHQRQHRPGDTHLMNLRAKDFSFPVAAAAASSKSRLFPDSMWPRTPSKPSGVLE